MSKSYVSANEKAKKIGGHGTRLKICAPPNKLTPILKNANLHKHILLAYKESGFISGAIHFCQFFKLPYRCLHQMLIWLNYTLGPQNFFYNRCYTNYAIQGTGVYSYCM